MTSKGKARLQDTEAVTTAIDGFYNRVEGPSMVCQKSGLLGERMGKCVPKTGNSVPDTQDQLWGRAPEKQENRKNRVA